MGTCREVCSCYELIFKLCFNVIVIFFIDIGKILERQPPNKFTILCKVMIRERITINYKIYIMVKRSFGVLLM